MTRNAGVRCPFILGGKTRLATELIAHLQADTTHWSKPVLLARTAAEVDEIRVTCSHCHVLAFDQLADELAGKTIDQAVIFCCALGPIHPSETSQPLCELISVQKELTNLQRLCAAVQRAPIHIVFVSTIVAISSGVGRYHYSGYKRLIDSAVHDLASEFADARVSVVYPGRMVASKDSMSSWLSTTFRHAARVIVNVGRHPSGRTMIGIDSRLFLIKRSIETLWSAITGRVR